MSTEHNDQGGRQPSSRRVLIGSAVLLAAGAAIWWTSTSGQPVQAGSGQPRPAHSTPGGWVPKLPGPQRPDKIPAAELDSKIARTTGHDSLIEACRGGVAWTCGVTRIEHNVSGWELDDRATVLNVQTDSAPVGVVLPCSQPGPLDDTAREFLDAAPIRGDLTVYVKNPRSTLTAGCASNHERNSR